MSLQQQIAAELRRRAQLLPGLIAEWQKQTDENVKGMGIHQSQVRAVSRMFAEFAARQDEMSKRLEPDKVAQMPPQEFWQVRQTFEQELTGSHSVLATFRHIFTQRADSEQSKLVLDTADLIAADCYLPCVRLANKWRDRPAEEFREPPLVYLNAKLSPAAITRRHYFGLLGLELYGGLEEQLPISVISLSFHDAAALWTFCSLYHEVGHLLDSDLEIGDEIKAAMEARLKASPNQKIWAEWWLAESIADAFGILLGGAGYAYSLMGMLHKTQAVVTGPSSDTHPTPYVRMFLICALLRGLGEATLDAAADDIRQVWTDAYGLPSAKWEPYVGECGSVADVLLNTKLDKLKGHALVEFVTSPAQATDPDKSLDHARTLELEQYLRLVIKRPDPKKFPRRLVPAAAQLAAYKVTADHTDVFSGIQKRTLAFLAEIPQPTYLAGGDAVKRHEDFLGRQISRVDFSKLVID